MPGTVLIGNDVEGLITEILELWGKAYPDPKAVTRIFLARTADVHRRYKAPCTLFVLGQVLEQNVKHFQKLVNDDIFDIQQHTYSHILLKTVLVEENNSVTVVPGGSLEEITKDIRKASSLFKKYLNDDCIGLAGPYGYYRGLSDRPDVLQILQDAGIRFVRMYARNEHDSQPVSFDAQPFWYKPQGFPDILEIPAQDWQDCIYRGRYGWEGIEGFLSHLKSSLDYVAKHDLTWSACFHDFSTIRDDPEMSIICGLIEHARKNHIRIMSCNEYYQETMS